MINLDYPLICVILFRIIEVRVKLIVQRINEGSPLAFVVNFKIKVFNYIYHSGVITMNNPVTAIYENGILRPLAPLNLPEHVQVQITIQPLDNPKEPSVSNSPKPTMAELWSDLDKINMLEPDIELPIRKDRPNPIFSMPNEFFV